MIMKVLLFPFQSIYVLSFPSALLYCLECPVQWWIEVRKADILPYSWFKRESLQSLTITYSTSVQFSCYSCPTLQPHEPQHARPPCPLPTPRLYPNSCPLSRWCHLTISSSVIPFSSYLQTFPTSGYFQMSQLLLSGSQNIGVSASPSVLPMNTQHWCSLGWTGWISLQSKGLSRDFSNSTVQKH